MSIFKKLFGKTRNSTNFQTGTETKISQKLVDNHFEKTSPNESKVNSKGVSSSNSKVEKVLSQVKELNIKMNPLRKDTWPGTPEWDKLISFADQQIEIAKSISPTELSSLEPFLKDTDNETRQASAFMIKTIHLNSITTPVPAKIIVLLGSLLNDYDLNIRNTAIDTLYHISKTTEIDSSVNDLINVISLVNKDEKIRVIEILSNIKQKSESVISALKKLTKVESADIATAARDALSKLGEVQEQEDEKEIVKRLLSDWESEKYGRFRDESIEYDELKNFPNPLIVCTVFKENLLEGSWSSDYFAYKWPCNLCKLLAEIGDIRFLEDLILLYRHFERKTSWKEWSGYISLAILRIKGGWEYVRKNFMKDEIFRFVQLALLVSSFDGGDEVTDYNEQLSEQEKNVIISNLISDDRIKPGILCSSLKRIGLAALDSLLDLYKKDETKKASAEAICWIPGALDSLTLQLPTTKIEEIISTYYAYTSGFYWNENLVRFMAKLKTDKCIAYLNQEALKRYKNQELTNERKALIESLLNSNS